MTTATPSVRRMFHVRWLLNRIRFVLVLAAVIVSWQLTVGRMSTTVQFFLPAPSTIVDALFKPGPRAPQLVQELPMDMIITLLKVLSGLALGFATGVPTGFAMARSDIIRWMIDPHLTAINTLPRIAVVPVLVLWLGFGPLPGLVLVWSAVYVVVSLNTYGGILDLDSRLIDHIRVLGARGLQIVRFVVLPGILPWLVSALRLALGYAWTVAILAETFGSRAGLGYLIVWYAGQAFSPGVFLVLLVITSIAVVLERVTARLVSQFGSHRADVTQVA